MHASGAVALPLALCLVAAAAVPARAYLDPGSGSMFLQLLLAGVAGAVVLLKMYWHRLLSWLRIRTKGS